MMGPRAKGIVIVRSRAAAATQFRITLWWAQLRASERGHRSAVRKRCCGRARTLRATSSQIAKRHCGVRGRFLRGAVASRRQRSNKANEGTWECPLSDTCRRPVSRGCRLASLLPRRRQSSAHCPGFVRAGLCAADDAARSLRDTLEQLRPIPPLGLAPSSWFCLIEFIHSIGFSGTRFFYAIGGHALATLAGLRRRRVAQQPSPVPERRARRLPRLPNGPSVASHSLDVGGISFYRDYKTAFLLRHYRPYLATRARHPHVTSGNRADAWLNQSK